MKEAEDMEKGISYIMGEFQGKVKEIKQISYSSRSQWDKGKHSRKVDVYYEIYTDLEMYILYMQYWFTNTIEKDMEGIYSLGLVAQHNDNEAHHFDCERVGIYHPGWDEE